MPRLRGYRQPKTFLEEHALESLKRERNWTISMYAIYNDLTEEDTEKLRDFLKPHLPKEQHA